MCSNRAATFLALELWQEALADAERARVLTQAALKRSPKTAGPAYVKTFAQKGAALMGGCLTAWAILLYYLQGRSAFQFTNFWGKKCLRNPQLCAEELDHY